MLSTKLDSIEQQLITNNEELESVKDQLVNHNPAAAPPVAVNTLHLNVSSCSCFLSIRLFSLVSILNCSPFLLLQPVIVGTCLREVIGDKGYFLSAADVAQVAFNVLRASTIVNPTIDQTTSAAPIVSRLI